MFKAYCSLCLKLSKHNRQCFSVTYNWANRETRLKAQSWGTVGVAPGGGNSFYLQEFLILIQLQQQRATESNDSTTSNSWHIQQLKSHQWVFRSTKLPRIQGVLCVPGTVTLTFWGVSYSAMFKSKSHFNSHCISSSFSVKKQQMSANWQLSQGPYFLSNEWEVTPDTASRKKGSNMITQLSKICSSRLKN